MFKFMEIFYESTIQFSSVSYPTSHLMVHHILKIASHLKAYEKTIFLNMLLKWNLNI